MPRVDCSVCGVEVTESVLKKVYYNPAWGKEITFGPYCRTCLGKIRVCSSCNKPHTLDRDIKYYGNGKHYCTKCSADMDICSSCNNEGVIHQVVDGKKFCQQCFDKKFKICKKCNLLHTIGDCVTDKKTRMQYKGYFKSHHDSCKTCFEKNKSRYKRYEVKECRHCGNFHADERSDYCDRCYKTFRECKECGKRHPTANHKSVTVNGNTVDIILCINCFDNKYKQCSSCRARSKNHKTIKGLFSNTVVCDSCYSAGSVQCPSCLKYHSGDDPSGRCSRCNQTYTDNKCTRCGATKDFNSNCRICYATEIYNYSYRPHPQFHYTEKDLKLRESIFFGIENECTFKTSASSRSGLLNTYEAFGPEHLLAKSDASISGPGYELVTQPVTLRYFHKQNILPFFPNGIQPSTTCGMHVHVSRGAFLSEVHIFKVTNFIFEFEKFVDNIVGRSYNGYNSKINKKISTAVKDSKNGNASRTARVNLTNPVTIEFRMFQGCTNEYEMRYRIEFLHALIKWTSSASISASKDKENLISFIKSKRRMYPNIFRFMSK